MPKVTAMLPALTRCALVIVLCILAVLNAEAIVTILELLRAEPQGAISLCAVAWALGAVLQLAITLERRSRRRADSSEVTVAAAPRAAGRAAVLGALQAVRERERSARHEAAHAAAAIALGRDGITASIVPEGVSGGRVSYSNGTGTPEDVAFQNIVIALAGNVVDHRGGHHDGGATADMAWILDRLLLILSTGRNPAGVTGELTIDGLTSRARSYAAAILDANAGAVDAIASALSARRTLTAKELSAFRVDLGPARPLMPADLEAAA